MKRKNGVIVMALIGALTAAAAWAQTYPAKAVRIIVPFPPGGTTDILAREVAMAAGARWGQTVVVENKGGASGTIGSEQVKGSAPDGYTLMITATHHVINPGLRKSLPYDTKRDFTSIALVATVPNVLVVNPAFPAQSVADLVRMAKAKPGSISFASTGIGGANHLSGELFKIMAGVDMVHVPYKGAAPAMNDLIAGHVPVMFDGLTGVLPQLGAGRLRALGVTTLRRVPALPNVPTIDEAGVKGFEVMSWFGLYGPANIPAATLQKISTDVLAVLGTPEMKERFAKHGAEPGGFSQPDFTRFVEAEIDKWVRVIEQAKIAKE
ncbi:MAG: tripartite tricarboxylate transporter substrate binding protein [Burkholderiales bacterium]|nr:tripartite tricarboxylate transporter substrate binding protein [Burkholderiales bacterium]